MCILMKGSCPLLKKLNVGKWLVMKFYTRDEDGANRTVELNAIIRHITDGSPLGYEGAVLVGLSIVEED